MGGSGGKFLTYDFARSVLKKSALGAPGNASTFQKPTENQCFWLQPLKNLRKINVFHLGGPWGAPGGSMKPHGRPMGPHGAPMGCPWGAMGPHGFVKTTEPGNIYIYIYTSVNPCISMHGAKQSRAKENRAKCHRDQHLRTGILSSDSRPAILSATVALKQA